ncbi:MAG: peptide chain release factor-like protein [Prosthecobacter sp.]|uniref:hypothetical protein n=1 Tax=Prosthecobacter sp. TaxID=1965333 RepID=UPI00262FBEB3|nr:hypothetical protein [Prosthecobacter sp.]MCF7789257.1 peptide chain release factor-like protein [Prosthecobacter sp.]
MFDFPRLLSLSLGLALMGFVSAKEPFKPNLGPELPRITVTCGDVTLLLRQATQWTPGRIDFRGKAMTTESSAYGTVFSFPDVGFIGTAHLENEPEKLQSLDFYLDDQRMEAPAAEIKGGTFRLDRKSRIRTFDLTNVTEIKDHRLYETTTVHTAEAVPLKLVYHFMHAWRPTVSAFLTGSDAAPEKNISGPLRDDKEVERKFYINERVDWMAVYEPKSGQFAVSRLMQAPELGGHIATIWNVPGTYRKFYLKCFSSATVPAGFTGTWRMATAFGSATPETWEAQARALAAELRNCE